MRYDDFLNAWRETLRRTGLPVFGFEELRLALGSLDRTYLVRVEPVGGQHAAPFLVTAELGWRWTALHTARTVTSEHDFVRDVLGEDASEIVTEPGWIRVDLVLHATTPYGKPASMPERSAWSEWTSEVTARMNEVERLTREDNIRESEDGRIELLAWQGSPTAEVACDLDGTLRLSSVKLEAWQSVVLPRVWSLQERPTDPPVEPQLTEMMARLKRALYGWSESLDRLARP